MAGRRGREEGEEMKKNFTMSEKRCTFANSNIK
jgi:hypothetical protein